MTGRVSHFGDAPAPLPLSLWSFEPDGTGSGSWNEEISPDDSRLENLKRSEFAYVASGGSTALMLGGRVTDLSDPNTIGAYEVPGIVEFNMTTQEFTNSSARGFTVNGTGFGGRMHYVPSFGPEGVFLIMGGLDNETLFDFGNLWVYDAVTNQFYNQTAGGNTPAARRDFCLAGINSTEGSYEIFLYGGTNGRLGPDAVPYDEIYILTLPAFHWLKVNYPPLSPRGGHSCNAVGGSQIASVGGFDANPDLYVNYLTEDVDRSVLNTSADPFTQGLGIFDLTTLTWADQYTANAPPYTQSEMVREYYRDNPPDGSQFSTTELQDLFRTAHFSQFSNETPQANSTSTSTPDANASSSNTGAIAGGVVGGPVGLAVLAGILFFFRRRQRSRQGFPGPGLQNPPREMDGSDAEYRLAQLDGQGIQEMQHPPAEMGGGDFHPEQRGRRYEMEATQRSNAYPSIL
ncbi:MAG: hypothetical protein Q9211_001044 [Gyalolechia sp. 1 TL-2023]